MLVSRDAGTFISAFRKFISLSVSMGVQIIDSSLNVKALWRLHKKLVIVCAVRVSDACTLRSRTFCCHVRLGEACAIV